MEERKLKLENRFTDEGGNFSQIAFREMIARYRYVNPKRVIQRALKLPSLSHTCAFDTTNLYTNPYPGSLFFLPARGRPISARKQNCNKLILEAF